MSPSLSYGVVYTCLILCLDLSRSMFEKLDGGDKSKYQMAIESTTAILDQLLGEADSLMKSSEKDVCHMTLGENYPWGSNMSVANNAVALLMAERLSKSVAFKVFFVKMCGFYLSRYVALCE